MFTPNLWINLSIYSSINLSIYLLMNVIDLILTYEFSPVGWDCRIPQLHLGVSSWCNGKSDGLRNRSKRVRTPVALLRSLSGKYPWERYEPLILPAMG